MHWVVLLEAMKELSTAPIDVYAFQRLVVAVSSTRRRALWSIERYAVHVAVEADTAAVAARSAVDEWEGASRQLGLPLWTVIRWRRSAWEGSDCRVEELDGETRTPIAQGVDDRSLQPTLLVAHSERPGLGPRRIGRRTGHAP